ncbi:hypothetical protein BDQ94DRAFT_150175 [Aspergillus welwitschiae]|uniref:Uncharacterized protein n=1 Tax=Aspergillus welwitschiae TaxID=1341132 RepID=A0A3F3PRU6_9EURO|nr:hypothetical protein BDQ94DRAFT_150175 [Aspergillus welwitschiae]RDH29657.1 hypothetical protein BDQ94DRAFT_150175 [Aspergillus welwitschiae]
MNHYRILPIDMRHHHYEVHPCPTIPPSIRHVSSKRSHRRIPSLQPYIHHTLPTLYSGKILHTHKNRTLNLGKNRSSTTVHTRQHATMEKEAEGIKSNA